MNKEDLGKHFIKDDVVYEAIGYTDKPTMELINRETGKRLSVVIDSDYANEFELVPEDKKIEKLKLINDYVSIDFTKDKISYCAGFEDVVNKINEIIDKINMED